MDAQYVWFIDWNAQQTAMNIFTVSKLVWTLSIRRQERKQKRKLDEAEITGQIQRGHFITFFLVIAFALLFNGNIFGFPGVK